nr:MAG TPA: hypothetical protein [Caudoviricetes sp.]
MSRIDTLIYRMNDKAHIILLEMQNKALKNTLNEIEVIADELLRLTNEYHDCYYKDACFICKKKNECQYYKTKQILNIISKAKGEE